MITVSEKMTATNFIFVLHVFLSEIPLIAAQICLSHYLKFLLSPFTQQGGRYSVKVTSISSLPAILTFTSWWKYYSACHVLCPMPFLYSFSISPARYAKLCFCSFLLLFFLSLPLIWYSLLFFPFLLKQENKSKVNAPVPPYFLVVSLEYCISAWAYNFSTTYI